SGGGEGVLMDGIDRDVKTPMKSGAAVRRDALRLVLSALRDAEKSARRPLTDDEVQAVLRRALKRRREAAKAFHDHAHAARPRRAGRRPRRSTTPATPIAPRPRRSRPSSSRAISPRSSKTAISTRS